MPMASARATKLRSTDGLLERAGLGVPQIVAGARPAEFGDHDPLAGEFVAQQAVDIDRLIDRLLVGEVFPVGQHVRGDEVDGRGEFRIVAPDVPDFACGHRDIDRFLDLLDQIDQVFDLLLAAIDRFVADDDADHVAVALGEIDGGLDLALVALGFLSIQAPTVTFRPNSAAIGGTSSTALGRGVQADGPRQRWQSFFRSARIFSELARYCRRRDGRGSNGA